MRERVLRTPREFYVHTKSIHVHNLAEGKSIFEQEFEES